MDIRTLKQIIPSINDKQLIEAILKNGHIQSYTKGEEVVTSGTYIKQVPIVLQGALKVMRENEDDINEVFLYYIKKGQTCALSLSCCSAYAPSSVNVLAEEDTSLLFIPIELHEAWMNDFKQWKDFVAQTFQNRFRELLDVVDEIAFKKMDERLLKHLMRQSRQQNSSELQMTHSDIAHDLGTSREVISRLLKQLEKRNLIQLGRNKIIFLES